MPLTTEQLMNKMREGDQRAGLEAARREDATTADLDELSTAAMARTRAGVAAHPATDPETLKRLAYDIESEVAGAVARRPGLPPDLVCAIRLRIQAGYTSLRGRERADILELAVALSDNPDVPLTVLDELQQTIGASLLPRVLARGTTREELLAQLARHPKATVRKQVIENPGTPAPLIDQLRSDPNEKVAAAAEEAFNTRFRQERREQEERLREHKRRLAAERVASYDEDSIRMAGGEDARRQQLQWFVEHLPEGEPLRALDLGCATGALSQALLDVRAGISLTGVDIAPAYLEAAGRRCGSRAEWLECDLDTGRLPLDPESVDYAVCWESLHAVDDVEAVLRSLLAVLKPGARFCGLFACLADDGPDNLLFAEAAGENGYAFQTYDEVHLMLATSGLVIEELSSAFEPVASATDPAVLESLGHPLWLDVHRQAVDAGAAPQRICRGIARVVGRKQRPY
jgi:SAM-dependent methyltransferase